ncbi:MAG: CdaR family protein [Myxococcota bacterium]|nr:CdaR family protein [Myxococcota bacterium]
MIQLPPNVQQFVREAVTDNLGLKIVALLIALMLTALVRFQQEGERLLDVELVPLLPSPQSGLVMTQGPPDTVRVRIRGPRSRVTSLRAGEIPQVEIDLSTLSGGTHYYYLSDETFELPSGIEFVRVTPESFPVKMERLASRDLPVRVRIGGKLKSGTELSAPPSVSPEIVSVVGPASVIRILSNVATEEVDAEGLNVGKHLRVVPARRIEGVELRGGDELNVTLEVRWIPGRRTLARLEVTVEDVQGLVVTPSEVSVSLAGPQLFLDRLDSASVRPTVKLPEDEITGRFSASLPIEVKGLPEGVVVTEISPAKVRVRTIASHR